MYLNIIKDIYDKPITSIILNGENLKPFLLKSGMATLPTPINIVLEFLPRTIRKEEEIKGICKE
jgi:hypothetical protein